MFGYVPSLSNIAKMSTVSMHVSCLQYKSLQQQHQYYFVSLSSPGTIELRASSHHHLSVVHILCAVGNQ